ncbi:protein CHROMATIN REMODELING 20 [Phragmites australis]|uniref:protein CHROMATIN REMODELING 20 n=1 Tax=Phragmites australis TaxID=29695 RepID=UPI002D7944C0|nr:protein CHROMATIN REMODELING 20 [Phragmites australis]XP_062205431.1 protein CHROMATIN REMODELING 20 [Phragmites australis]XP_062205432.1 protein CHROMATIN REMODELING 20 [Phragmites australis]
MDKNGILSDGKLKKMESVPPNGQLEDDDVMITESEWDETKAGAKSSIRDGLFKEHKEPECGTMYDGVHEEVSITDDVSETDSYEFFLRESDNEPASASEEDIEVPLTEEEVEELVAEFLDVESKAAEAQESLEKESLDKIETEVRLELSERLQGDELESAVSTEMEQFRKQWEIELDDLEIHSSILLEQLDAAGIELPRLFKSIESQVPNVCETEAWKSRTHWAGSQVPEEANQSIKKADKYLQSCRPVRRKHGRLLEEGASGFLAGKVPVGNDDSIQCHEKSWSSFNELIKSKESAENSFGSSNWASVYLASTPQEAASLGLQFPGVDEVEEISEVDSVFADIKGVDEIELSEEQKRKYRKVREEDDAKIMKCLQRRLKGRRTRGCKEDFGSVSSSNGCYEKPPPSKNDVLGATNGLPSSEKLKTDENEVSIEMLKRTREDDDELDQKRLKTVIIESDDDMQIDGKPALHKDGECSSGEVEKVVDIIDLDLSPSQSPKLSDKSLSKAFKCTICTEMLNASDVHRHPVLDVTVCGLCRFLVIEKNRLEDPVSGGYCTWCAQSEQLQSCSSCKLLFCTNCLSKNLGEQCLSEAKVTGWQCCCCIPSQLELLISECDKALSVESSDPESSNTELSGPENNGPVSKRKMKKRIRRIIDDTELGEETKRKIAMEKARQDHLKSMQEQSASKLRSENIGTSFGAVSEVSLEDAGDGHIVNLAREEDEEPVRIPSSMSSKLKPHQVEGIRFMWENVIQSVKKVKSGDKGLGCILAHNMGLGKTFQVITFLYTGMRYAQLGLRTALIVTPVNVLHNWRKEFTKWRPAELKPLRVFMLEDVARVKRPYLLDKWRLKGGVLLIGYSSFRNLSLGKHVKDKNTANDISYALQCGPDILVCDEAHMIKNRRADITQALKQVRTQRRIALTGSPLQNNLMEYYCMVDFVREGFLGSSHEFRNRFQNPIENGQHTNSTSDDVKVMNQRSHILFEQLKGFVQRMGMNVVKNDLPPKKVFVITVKLSQLQRKLYRRFLDVHGFSSSGYSEKSHSSFFAKYQTLAQVWNHPGLLQMAKEQRGNLRQEDAVENFLMDESSSDDNVENSLPNGEKQKDKTDQQSKKSNFVNEEGNWWEDLLDENTYMEADYSGKMILLLDILSRSSELGDKVLVFSQSLTTLDLVEFYLSKMQTKGKEGKHWKRGKDWYRLDGSTPSSDRQNLVERFNDPENTRVKCTLISTRAGSLGINLHAANRVVLLDGSWNPTHDLQAIYRVWRYGQTKPVYAYRLMAHRTMEEKIYKRQVTKEGLAARVVDRQQVSRTISKEEMLHLFEFGDEELVEQSENSSTMIDCPKVVTEKPSTSNTIGTSELVPVDRLMLNLLSEHTRWIAGYHEHEALLQENEEERLTKEEQDMALSEWEALRKAVRDPDRKSNTTAIPTDSNLVQPPKVTSRSRQPQQPKVNSSNQKKCNNLTHLLTLRSHGTKAGCTTICKECDQEICWETLNREGRSR